MVSDEIFELKMLSQDIYSNALIRLFYCNDNLLKSKSYPKNISSNALNHLKVLFPRFWHSCLNLFNCHLITKYCIAMLIMVCNQCLIIKRYIKL